MKSILKSKSTKIVITILLSIFTLFFLSTIAYSAFSSTMNITGIARSRVETDVRITNFSLDQIVNATSNYEEFSKNTVSTSITLQENSYAIYKLEVTNYGETEVSIYNINGFPQNITYEIIDYNLKDKICNINGKCNNYATKVFYIKITGNNQDISFTLDFEFKVIHKITYINFTNEYISHISDNDSIEIDLSKDAPKFVYITSEKKIDYTYQNNKLKLNNITAPLTIEAINESMSEFNYTGNYQIFTVPYDGLYKVELWGASGGGTSSYPGGAGAYTSGDIYLNKGEKLYVYVGQGGYPERVTIFNNGTVTYTHGSGMGYAGGGSTDIRLLGGDWDDFDSIKSRIMVAAAGGGALTYYSAAKGGAAGGLTGYAGTRSSGTDGNAPTAGTQTSAGTNGRGTNDKNSVDNKFGVLFTGGHVASGGNGYYPGGNGPHGSGTVGSGAGGSSFISGHNGCNAIAKESTYDKIVHTNQSVHYSDYMFLNTKMIDGQGYTWTTSKGSKTNMPTFDGISTMTGNTTDGYAKITLIDIGVIYRIKYTNIEGIYQTEINKGEILTVNFRDNAVPRIKVLVNQKEHNDYTYENGILRVNNILGNVEIKNDPITYEYSYTGNYQTFITPASGVYKVELWGAQGGGDSTYVGGKGSYTSGDIVLDKDQEFFIYVGEYGINSTKIVFNNGSYTRDFSTSAGYGGGGSTDIRLVNGNWDDFNSLKSRIMVAASGSGAATYYYEASGVAGGGLTGYSGSISGSDGVTATGGTQTSAGRNGRGTNIGSSFSQYNKFGLVLTSGSRVSSAGNGYYAGGNGAHGTGTVGIGGSGSSFISGHNGCNAIDASSTETSILHTGQSIHYSNWSFTNTVMIDGSGYQWTTSKGSQTGMPTQNGTSTMTGNTGHGYAKITYLKERVKYNIKYTDIDGTYKTEIYRGETLTIDFKENAPLQLIVYENNIKITDYTYENGILIINNVSGNIEIKNNPPISKFSYTGDVQVFTAPYSGTYKIELWGAQGGGTNGGAGGYTSGIIELEKNKDLYVYVGGQGNDNQTFNNGNKNVYVNNQYGTGYMYAGGGSTDIRLVQGTWDSFHSTKTRIMVAAGGGGATGYYSQKKGGVAGGLTGGNGVLGGSGTNIKTATGATQTSGGGNGVITNKSPDLPDKNFFGYPHQTTNQYAGGGNGYYAGGTGGHGTAVVGSAAGGSSFISGHNGCDAIAENSTEVAVIHTGQSVHYSNYSFTNTVMIDGGGYSWTNVKGSQTGMPSHDGTSTVTGNTGDGYAKITLIELT